MKIGFIDYFLSEWHANNYPAMFDEYNAKTGENFQITHAYAELDISPYDNVTTDEWCERFKVKKCTSIAELTSAVDCVIVLSPDNPEKHLKLCQEAFISGKPTYVDKTFAPSLAEAKQIFECARAHKTPIFSSSALRYSTELDAYKSFAESVITSGGGGSLERYGVHQMEMIQRLMGNGAKRVKRICNGKNISVVVDYGQSRRAVINYNPFLDFNVCIESSDKEAAYLPIRSNFFGGLIGSIAQFFKTKQPPVSESATLEIMAVLEAINNSRDKIDEWVNV